MPVCKNWAKTSHYLWEEIRIVHVVHAHVLSASTVTHAKAYQHLAGCVHAWAVSRAAACATTAAHWGRTAKNQQCFQHWSAEEWNEHDQCGSPGFPPAQGKKTRPESMSQIASAKHRVFATAHGKLNYYSLVKTKYTTDSQSLSLHVPLIYRNYSRNFIPMGNM